MQRKQPVPRDDRLLPMKLHSGTRRWLASLLAAVFLCLQFVTSAYACPRGGDTGSAAMAAMPDCAGMTEPLDPDQPQLCKAHCDQDKQSVNTLPAPIPDAAAVLAIDWLLSRAATALAVADVSPLPAVRTAHSAPPAGTPPAYLAFLVLRN